MSVVPIQAQLTLPSSPKSSRIPQSRSTSPKRLAQSIFLSSASFFPVRAFLDPWCRTEQCQHPVFQPSPPGSPFKDEPPPIKQAIRTSHKKRVVTPLLFNPAFTNIITTFKPLRRCLQPLVHPNTSPLCNRYPAIAADLNSPTNHPFFSRFPPHAKVPHCAVHKKSAVADAAYIAPVRHHFSIFNHEHRRTFLPSGPQVPGP